MSWPIALTDAQRAMITAAAKPRHARDRTPFLEAVAARLHAVDEIGDGVVGRIVRELRRSFLPHAPQSRTVGGHPRRFFRLNAFGSTAG